MTEQKNMFVSACSFAKDRPSMMFTEALKSTGSEEAKGIEGSFGENDREVNGSHLSIEEVRSKRDCEFEVFEETVSLDTLSTLSCELNEGLASDKNDFSRLRDNESHCGSGGSSVVESVTLTRSTEVEIVYGEREDGGRSDMIIEQSGPDHETLCNALKSSSEQEPSAMENESLAISTIEGMDSDDFNEQFCFSVEELQESTEAINGCTETPSNGIADHFVPYQVNGFATRNLLPETLGGRICHNNGGFLHDQSLEASELVYNDATDVNSVHVESEWDEGTKIDAMKNTSRTMRHISISSDYTENVGLCEGFEESEETFSVSDLVWGKVKSHPWWPGQIFDPSDASERAMKYYKSDCFLVAYFGDRTFAWNEPPLLKPFRSHFSEVEKQSNSEAFHNAVTSALDEVARRVELGLSCSCVPDEDLERIKHQTVENTGIKPESSCKKGRDHRLGIKFFDPKHLIDQIKQLALSPSDGADRLDLAIAKSQLKAVSRLQTLSNLYKEVCFEDSYADVHKVSYVQKRDEIDIVSSEGKNSISSTKTSSIPKPSFKIGECIRRVASQMTCSPKQNIRESSSLSEYSSFDDLFAHFFFLAEHPYRKHNISPTFMNFFSNFRNSIIINQNDKDGRMKEVPFLFSSPETFEFEDMSDTYWTDRVIQNGSDCQPTRKGQKRNLHLVSGDSIKRSKRSNSKKKLSEKDENAPAELVMHFPVVDSVPSESNLSRMFKRFGPLKESDTEVDRDTNRARVVFKKSSDAEAACSSASKFNIFGQTVVNYQLNYTISVPFKSSTLVPSLPDEDVALFLEY